MTNDTQLLPCPFCGAEQPQLFSALGCYFIECVNCGAARNVNGSDTPEEAIAEWNRRAPVSLPEDAVKSLAEQWACRSDYPNMDAETKDALHQLVNAAGDRLYQNVELWRRELGEAGWKEKPRMSTIWISPEGALYIGPYGAWKEMKRRSK